MRATSTNDLLECMKKHAISYASPTDPIILSSGKKSLYYFDVKKALFDHNCLKVIVKHLVNELNQTNFDSVGGMEFGAVPLVAGVTMEMDVKSFVVRKERKGHGLKKVIEGHLDDEDTVIILDDVTTTGDSVTKTIETITKNYPSVKIAKIITVVDREEGAKELFAKLNIDFSALFTFSEVRPYLRNKLIEKYGIETVSQYGL